MSQSTALRSLIAEARAELKEALTSQDEQQILDAATDLRARIEAALASPERAILEQALASLSSGPVGPDMLARAHQVLEDGLRRLDYKG